MKKIFVIIIIIICYCVLVANPIVQGPILIELFRDGNDWQITLFNQEMIEFTLDNCGISTGSGFSEFNDGIDFFETVTVSNEDLQDSLYIDWESDCIITFFDCRLHRNPANAKRKSKTSQAGSSSDSRIQEHGSA